MVNKVNLKRLEDLLRNVQQGRLELADAMQLLKKLPFEDLGYAKVDNHRCLRNGAPEVIYCESKTIPQIQNIVRVIAENNDNILATRADRNVFNRIEEVVPDCVYHEEARIVVIKPRPLDPIGNMAVVCAGTADIPVAEEAVATADLLGSRVETAYDVGVAGIHRLLDKMDRLRAARVIIAVAGMEGALVSVVGGLVACPVIAVPTRVGYGAAFEGLAALLTMLNSCAPGVSVVNIDNGFGAGCLAHRINLLGEPQAI